VPFDSAAPITHQLWQTSKSKDLGKRASLLHSSWKQLNPGMIVTLVNDTEAADFVSSFYGPEVSQLYAAYPLGVMRADLWRYLVVYAQGGVYSDIDTQCLKPLAEWFPPRPRSEGAGDFVSDNSNWTAPGPVQFSNLSWDDCSMVIGLENDVHFCQWTFASVPGHPVLRSVLHVALRSLEGGMQCAYDHMVHAHTGPGVWTEGIRKALGLPDKFRRAGDVARAAWLDPEVYQRARELRLCIVARDFFGKVKGSKVPAQNVQNMYSSKWKDEGPNTPWIRERARLVARHKELASSPAVASNGTAP
jgi:alpha 1,6-mannosyltransferase